MFQEEDYKIIIRNRVREMSRKRANINLRKAALHLGIQYTYLSKILHNPKAHLSEDHLFSLAEYLQFFPVEIEYLQALRSLALSSNEKRKQILVRRLQSIRSAQLVRAEVQESKALSSDESNFLLSPLIWLCYFALGIKANRENPKRLCHLLNISLGQLQEILTVLQQLTLIDRGDSPFSVKKISKNHFHYDVTHPLMRIHQQLLRSYGDSLFLRIDESKKYRFMVTFNANEAAVQEIREEYSRFLKICEKIVTNAPSEQTYQLSFDLFPWF